MTDAERMITGWSVLAAVILLIVLYRILKRRSREKALFRRQMYLYEKFGDTDIVERIIARKVWQGMSQECLVESWGPPDDIDEKVLKNKVKETWKYGATGKNRYAQRVYVENGVVVGWHDQ